MQMGLAQQMAQGTQASTGTAGSPMTLEEVVEALLNGTDPQTLIEKGVPVELVKQAAEAILAAMEQKPEMQEKPMTESGKAMVQRPAMEDGDEDDMMPRKPMAGGLASKMAYGE